MRTPGDVRPAMQEVLDTALAMAPASAQAHFSLVLAEREYGPGRHKVSTAAQIEDVASLTAWITATNASDEAIQHVERAAMALAERHTQVPAPAAPAPRARRAWQGATAAAQWTAA